MREQASLARSIRRMALLVGIGWATALGLDLSSGRDSVAFFSDEAEVAANVFQTATLDLTASPTSALLGLSNMQPGDQLNGSLTLSNAGTIELRYAMTTEVTAGSVSLAESLQLTIRAKGTSCAAFDGTELYNGPMYTAAIGNPAPGSQAGDRLLGPAGEAGDSEQLCFRASLPLSVGNDQQGAQVELAFVFAAEQTANNP